MYVCSTPLLFVEAFTFLVPTLLTLAKFAHPQPQTTAPPSRLPKMPMVDVPAATTISTEAPRKTRWWLLSQGLKVSESVLGDG